MRSAAAPARPPRRGQSLGTSISTRRRWCCSCRCAPPRPPRQGSRAAPRAHAAGAAREPPSSPPRRVARTPTRLPAGLSDRPTAVRPARPPAPQWRSCLRSPRGLWPQQLRARARAAVAQARAHPNARARSPFSPNALTRTHNSRTPPHAAHTRLRSTAQRQAQRSAAQRARARGTRAIFKFTPLKVTYINTQNTLLWK